MSSEATARARSWWNMSGSSCGPRSSRYSFRSSTSFLGDSGLPVLEAGQAASQQGEPTHHDQNYAGMTHDPPGSGTHAAHGYEDYKHQGREA